MGNTVYKAELEYIHRFIYMCITDPSHLYSVYVNSSATQYYSNRDAQGGHFPPKSNDDSLPCLLPISLFYASRVPALLPWRMRSSYALHPGLYLRVAVVWHVTIFSFQPFSLILSTIGWILGNAPSPLNHYLPYSILSHFSAHSDICNMYVRVQHYSTCNRNICDRSQGNKFLFNPKQLCD